MIFAIEGIKRDIALSADVLPAAVAPANSIYFYYSPLQSTNTQGYPENKFRALSDPPG